ncbi:MAG TPA: biosynthetic peptidoglycan transglycosylase [Gemmatimonadales bacterium]|jgi:monofunctional biosynthetic peptidoglycan transglycosylase|nr:biosynthetic peptidoglycan transglycosylase [Gemmatimonadales bacterium]
MFRRLGRWTAGVAGLAVLWLFAVWPPPVWWRSHSPRVTAMMRVEPGPPDAPLPVLHPVPLSSIASVLERMVIIGEDSRFKTHHGIDFVEIGDALQVTPHSRVWPVAQAAWRRRDRVRGASTITQQLAKNLYLSPSRNPLRKLKEAVTALRLELALPKDRIMELYLNVVEWGPGVWGVDQASRSYFGVSPANLDEEQAAELAATLPHPRSSNPIFHPALTLARRDLILARYRGYDVRIPPDTGLDSLLIPVIPQAVLDSLTIELPADSDTAQSDSS